MCDRIAHARLGGKVQHHVWRLLVEYARQRGKIADVQLPFGESFVCLEPVRPVALERNAVVGIEIVDSHHLPATTQERERRMVANETGRTRN